MRPGFLLSLAAVLWLQTPRPPLSVADLVLLLQLQAPRPNVQKLIETRGVDFAVTQKIAAEILAAGGDNALVGVVALHQKAAAAPAVSPAPAPASFPDPSTRALIVFQRIPPYEAGAPGGVCDLRVRVDHVTDFLLQGDRIIYEVQRGSPPADAGSTCTQPFPAAPVSVTLTKVRGRGAARLLTPPSASNQFSARIQIEDPGGGADLYHVRLSWGK